MDDDREVLSAVARELRRKYGSDFRVLRADSGATAIDTLKEIKLRDDWLASFRPPFEGIRVVGHRYSPHSHQVKDFLRLESSQYLS